MVVKSSTQVYSIAVFDSIINVVSISTSKSERYFWSIAVLGLGIGVVSVPVASLSTSFNDHP